MSPALPQKIFAVDPPQVLDSRLTLELVAAEPDIITPTGIAVDAHGRIYCIENNTHQTAPGYKGPKTDRIRVFEDFDAAGKARKITTFAEGFRDSMGLTFSREGVLYLTTRAALYRFDGNKPQAIVRLETKGNYPHNGLCGFTWAANGDLIFGLGENLGAAYKVVGSDGSSFNGGGEGGSMYRCRPDGAKVARIATGFWNPFAHCVDAHGNLFAVDNDPDARGPCRLLHVIQGGDFGYRFRYGRNGSHPFQCWNGELPGTLPMVAGTSEAPSGVIPCDFTAMPADYAGKLLVTSWGDYTIEAFELSPRGASFTAKPKAIVRGNEQFRPVAFAIAPDGTVVFNDWVKKDYPVHGHGRIWRLRTKPEFRREAQTPRPASAARSEATWAEIARNSKSANVRMRAVLHLHSPQYLRELVPLLADADPFLASAALEALGRPAATPMLLKLIATPDASLRLGILLALRRSGAAQGQDAIAAFLKDPDPAVRRAAIQWVAEEPLIALAADLQAAAAKAPVTRELFEAWLAARELLDGKERKDTGKDSVAEAYVAAVLRDPQQPVIFHRLALRMLRHDHPQLTAELFASLFRQSDPELRHEVVRTLILRPDASSQALLRTIAADESIPSAARALAVTGLAHSIDSKETQALLDKLKDSVALSLDIERVRQKPDYVPPMKSADRWRALLKGDGVASAGERVFFRANGPGCYKCHRIDGRGYAVGPDLTLIGRSSSRDKLIDSILEPSKEIAPAYAVWRIATQDGKERVGMIVGETFDSMLIIADAQGTITKIHRTAIEDRTALPISIMPQELASRMTPQEFRDLLAFLLERR